MSKKSMVMTIDPVSLRSLELTLLILISLVSAFSTSRLKNSFSGILGISSVVSHLPFNENTYLLPGCFLVPSLLSLSLVSGSRSFALISSAPLFGQLVDNFSIDISINGSLVVKSFKS